MATQGKRRDDRNANLGSMIEPFDRPFNEGSPTPDEVFGRDANANRSRPWKIGGWCLMIWSPSIFAPPSSLTLEFIDEITGVSRACCFTATRTLLNRRLSSN